MKESKDKIKSTEDDNQMLKIELDICRKALVESENDKTAHKK